MQQAYLHSSPMPPIFLRMMMADTKHIYFVAVLISSLMIHSKWVSAADQITAFTEQVYPLNYTKSGDDDGQVIGFATELVIAVLDEAGLDYEIKIGPWARAIRAINTMSNVLAYPTVRTADLESK